jgi:hypothetical protein
MKKPDRVEVGQWWGSSNDADCFRVEGIANKLGEDWALHGDGKFATPCSQLLKLSTYEHLGSGDHPEPSEWMIETLAEHAWNSRGDDIEWEELGLEFKNRIRLSVRALVSGDSGDPFEWNATVLSLYSILRSLGKW